MKTPSYRIVPLPTEVAEAARARAHKGAVDHVLMETDALQSYPCRHCLRWAQLGESVVLFPYSSIPPGRPYSESGPIFVHAEACARYRAVDEFPADFRSGRVVRAYDRSRNMIDAEVVNGSEPETVVEKLFANPDTAFLQVRSMDRGCFTFAIERV